jgi:sugar phosphate isomerase/epimerase
MNHVLSTHVFVNHRLTVAWLSRIQQIGIPAVEIFCARQHLDYRDKAQIAELGHWFRDSDLKLHSLHAPMYTDEIWGRSGPHAVVTITEPVKGQRLQMVDEIKRALEIAEVIPFKYLIQHMGVGGEEFDMRKFDAAFSALEELSLFARQRGVEILLENIPNELSSAERLKQFEELTHIGLNYVFDTGHANMNEGVEAAFQLMKHRIRSTHVHDNDGKNDQHLFPLVSEGGTIDWKETMSLLRSGGDKFPLLLELKEKPEFPNALDTIQQVFKKLEEI